MMTAPDRLPQTKRPLSPERRAEIDKAPYDVGFGKPPQHSRFKKGRSGNSKGRPRHARALKTDLLEILDQEIAIGLPGGREQMTMQRAMILNLTSKAVMGDTRAAQTLIRLTELTAPERLRETTETQSLDPAEQAMFARLLDEMGLKAPPTPVGEADDGTPQDDPAADPDPYDFI